MAYSQQKPRGWASSSVPQAKGSEFCQQQKQLGEGSCTGFQVRTPCKRNAKHRDTSRAVPDSQCPADAMKEHSVFEAAEI